MTNFQHRATIFASLLLSSAIGATPAFAADAPASATESVDAAGDDIIVTARFREEKVQDVPIAITAISGQQLQATGNTNLLQIQQLAPSLQIFAFNPRNTNINIRGLGSNVAVAADGLDYGVGVYVDGVYYGRVGSTQFDLVDLDRVEVLRGPQGTLFGKNTTAGAISITSRAPTFTTEGSAELSGGNYGYHQVKGSLSGAIIDDLLAARVSISDTHRDGFVRNVRTDKRLQDYDNSAVRAQLLFTPSSTVRVRLIGDYSRQKQNCCVQLPDGVFTQYDNGAPVLNNVNDRLARLGYTPLPYDLYARKTDVDAPVALKMKNWGISGQLDWDVTEGVALTSITAYRRWTWTPQNDNDYFGVPVLLKSNGKNFQRQFSQEVRLASTGQRNLDWVIGGYYYWQSVKNVTDFLYGSAAPLWFVNPAAVPTSISGPALDGFGTTSTANPVTRSFAAFGQGTWHTTDRLAVTVGLRFTHEKKEGDFTQVQFGPSLAGLPAATAAAAQGLRNSFGPNAAFSASNSNDSLTGTLNLAYKVSDTVLGYATYSRGNQSGGLNLVVLPAGVTPVVKPQKINNYEIGLKNQLFDRALTLNLAGFWTEVEDYQTSIVDVDTTGSSGLRTYIANIKKVRSRGVEAEATLHPVTGITLGASGTYTDAKYVSYTNGACPPENQNLGRICDLSGQPLAGAPKYAYSLSADAVQPIGGIEVDGRVDYSYRSSYFTAVSNSRYSRVEGYGLTNLRIGFRRPGGAWDVAVWARNLFDVNYAPIRTVADTGLYTALTGDRRTIGATLRSSF
ncbi:MAG: TonB-dependent receptor [Sphingomonadales bacterium]|nr:TonB-dependent receptor [Sphingomonadales bacterium]